MTLQNNILNHFQNGGRLTVQRAIQLFHTTELRKIVSRLRRSGHNIRSVKKTGESIDGRKIFFNEYFLEVCEAN